MKTKITLAAVIFGALVSGSAFAANTGTINFIGSVSDTTCDIIGEQGGVQGNTVDLGTYTVDAVTKNTTQAVDFSLVGKKPNGSACDVKHSVDISWVPASGSWGADGLQNSGTAQGVAVKLMDTDSKPFSASRESVNYIADKAPNGTMPFKAQLVKSGTAVTAGTVISAVKFAVSYK